MADLEERINESQKLGMQIIKESDDDRLMTLSVGPQHPGSGHFRFVVKVDGDYIVHCDPDPGYVHRGEEKMTEASYGEGSADRGPSRRGEDDRISKFHSEYSSS